jgi:hypothetical protein
MDLITSVFSVALRALTGSGLVVVVRVSLRRTRVLVAPDAEVSFYEFSMRFRFEATYRDLILESEKDPDPDPMVNWAFSQNGSFTKLEFTPPTF